MLPEKMKIFRGRFTRMFILLVIGLFISAQQVSSESIFDRRNNLSLSESKLGAPDFGSSTPAALISASADTVEVYDIELSEEEEERNIYKEVAIYAIVVGAVGYFVYTLIKPDDEETIDDGGGKEPPITPSISFSIPLSR